MMQQIPSEYLSASAGSGKTYALSRRFCQLVMAGVEPEEICALTFTRPATREIFSAIIERLLKDKTLDGNTRFTRKEALSRILKALSRLQISTIDAFSAKVGRLFAYEVGLDPDFSLYEGEKSVEGQAIINEMLRRAFQHSSTTSREELLSLFDIQEAALAESKPLSQLWKGFWASFSPLLLSHPDGWGDLKRLDVGEITRATTDVKTLVARAHELIETDAFMSAFEPDVKLTAIKKAIGKLHELLENYCADITSIRYLKDLKTLSDGDKERWCEYVRTGIFYYNRATTKALNHHGDNVVPSQVHEIFSALWFDLIARDLEQTSFHTRELYRALKALQEAETQLTTETGQVSFTAITRTLSAAIGGNLSVRNMDAFYVAYRLDAAIRHLMIDEFQDTSIEQWQVLSGIANELAFANDGTFFYVGDTKQSIYAWRGGDATLFADATRLPNIPAGKPLVESYRSVAPVIEFVNQVMQFNWAACDETVAWHSPTLQAWNEGWNDHISKRDGDGFVQMLALNGTREVWVVTAAKLIATRWRELSQSKKKLKIAVLASTNDVLQGENGILRYLRQAGVPCAVDGKRQIADTPMGALLIQLLHWMSDPRATYSRGIASLLGIVTGDDKTVLTQWMRCVNQKGFAGWLDVVFGEQTAIRQRMADMDVNVLHTARHALEQLDQQGKTDPAEACATLKMLQVPCSADTNVVNLMTIHHAKGLTYDVVFTIFSGKIVNEQQSVHEVGQDWVLERPAFKPTYDCVDALNVARETRQNARLYDRLCMLYVALTRASYEQIVLAPMSDAKSLASVPGWVYQKVLVGATACMGIANADLELPKLDVKPTKSGKEKDAEPVRSCYRAGNADWWQLVDDKKTGNLGVVLSPIAWKADFSGDETEVDLPSEKSKARTITDLLSARGSVARGFGITLHDQLSQVEWSDTPPEGLFPEVFRKPDEPCELWRERPYSVSLRQEGQLRYSAGQFDRVHLFPKSRSAVIYDFKTSREAEITPAYQKQMLDYRAALAALTGYAEKDIRLVLLFTRHRVAMEVTE